jgi:signal transduction histidine kinase
MQVGVDVHVPARPDAAVESAAYFVAAEGLANAAKHANASRVEIRVERRDAFLYVSIVDDGRGGADPRGSGLAGLRRRVEALDGRLRVASPPGGPTILSAELACG